MREARLVVASTWDGAPLAEEEQTSFRLRFGEDELGVEVEAPFHGDPPPPGPPGPCEGLWEHEVVELFLLGEGERYLELELGPHGHHLVLQLDGRRRATARGLPLDLRVRREGARWRGLARVPGAWLPPGPLRANAYAIHGQGPRRRYLAAFPVPGPEPDFHRLERFRPLTAG